MACKGAPAGRRCHGAAAEQAPELVAAAVARGLATKACAGAAKSAAAAVAPAAVAVHPQDRGRLAPQHRRNSSFMILEMQEGEEAGIG